MPKTPQKKTIQKCDFRLETGRCVNGSKQSRKCYRNAATKRCQKNKTIKKAKPLTDDRYHALVQQRQSKKRLSSSDKTSLDTELNLRFCKCLRTVKYSKKIKKGSQYPICMRSIYKNRGFEVPKGVIKNCSKTKS